MIKSFRDRRSEAFFNGQRVKDFQAFERQAVRRLQILDNATSLKDLRQLRSNRFEALHGRRTGQYGIRINRQWRICFEWSEGDVHVVEITDYH